MMDNISPISTISVHALKQLYDNDPALCLIDVRELDEWMACHIPKAHHIPKDQLPHLIHNHVPQLSQAIYLHCRSGVRSMQAADCLKKLGYRSIYSVDGGIMEWAQAGYPIESSAPNNL